VAGGPWDRLHLPVPLILAGIDEAGYGPLLGPLCVGAAVLRVEEWTPGDQAPDVWKLLSRAVCRKAGDKRQRIAVDDSKKLKGPNDRATRHPLHELERAVLAFLACLEHRPNTDLDLFSCLHAATERHPWYEGSPGPCPVSLQAEQVGIAANLLRGAFAGAGAGLADLRCCAVGEAAFNDLIARTGTKAATTGWATSRHLRDIWARWGTEEDSCCGGPRVVCDAHGGRTDYADFLARAVPGASVEIIEQSPRRSRYVLNGTLPDDPRPRAMTVMFMPEAESACLPVALASMTAKLVRELMMARFNRYWCALVPQLKPTAGYNTDARRWLSDAGPILTPDLRATLIRRA
jgi:ribonuclease HII